MCRATTCKVCGKTTWAGCGQHIESVRKSVPSSQWCNGSHSPSQIQAEQGNRGGFFARLLGR